MSDGYIVALDVGNRRIGVAIASTVARMPRPLVTIDINSAGDVFVSTKKIVDDNSASTVVVGLPRDMKGEETAQTKIARDFAKQLENVVEVPVVMQDEAATSVVAEQRLNDRGKPYDKSDIDAEAACLILEDYLNNMGRTQA